HHRSLPSFPTRRSSDLGSCGGYIAGGSLRSPGGDRSPDGRTDHDHRPDLLHPRLTRLPGSGAVPADTALGWPGAGWDRKWTLARSEEHTSELQSRENLV